MQNAALREAGLDDWVYQRLPVPPELFEETVRGLPAAGFVGANVTIPHKEAALALADSATDVARDIGAANTLTFAEGRIHADNTDAPGLLAALDEDLEGKTALVLGAGGSARAVVYALIRAGASVRVWNRTAERARALGVEVVEPPLPGADLLVNCTSVGLDASDETFKVLPLHADALSAYATVADLVYRGDGDTPLLSAARDSGCRTVDGLDILVGQGALSFEAWTGRRAPLPAMRKAVRGAPPRLDEPRQPTSSPRSDGPGGDS
jgi:shikimate dehydrogenase